MLELKAQTPKTYIVLFVLVGLALSHCTSSMRASHCVPWHPRERWIQRQIVQAVQVLLVLLSTRS